MTTAPRPSRLHQLLIAVIAVGVLLGAAAMLAAWAVIGHEREDDTAEVVRLDDGIVAVIEGVEITELEWELALLDVHYLHDYTLAQLELDAEAHPLGEPGITLFERQLQALEAYAPEAIALSSLIAHHSVTGRAYTIGIEPDPAAVAEEVERQRETTRGVLEGELPADAVTLAHIEARVALAGEDRYWDEVVPREARHARASHELWEAHGGNQQPDWRERWDDFRAERARNARVQISPELAERVSVDDARAYAEAIGHVVEQFQQELAALDDAS